MTDVSNRSRETAAGKGGRFATEQRTDPGLDLDVPAPEILSYDSYRTATSLHGTVDADGSSSYYEAMTHVFNAASALTTIPPEQARDNAAEEAITDYSRLHGIRMKELRDFYDNVKDTVPGSHAWTKALYIDPPGPTIDGYLETFRGLQGKVDEVAERRAAERRELLLNARARIDAELAGLDG